MTVIIKQTGENVDVYRSKMRDTFINSDDCNTEYVPIHKDWKKRPTIEVETV